jgi:hypothetical protein
LPWRLFVRGQSGRGMKLSTNPSVVLRLKIIAATLPQFLPSWHMQGHLYFNFTFLGMRQKDKKNSEPSFRRNYSAVNSVVVFLKYL